MHEMLAGLLVNWYDKRHALLEWTGATKYSLNMLLILVWFMLSFLLIWLHWLGFCKCVTNQNIVNKIILF
jgi:uncharacterized membrane protein